MGLDIFVVRYKNQEPATFPRRIVEEVFEKYIGTKESDCWSPEFPDGGGCNVFIDAAPEIKSFSVSHPASSTELWDCLFEVLRQTGCFLFWPDGQAVVADPAVLAHLNAGLLDLFGPGIVVQNGKDIFDAIDG
jgi:hypothetical protein